MKRVLPYLILVAEAIVFFRHILFVPGYIIPWDLHSLHLPYGYLYAEALARGEFPLWDPYTYCGRPFFATIQAAVLYPTVWLASWIGSIAGREHIFYMLELSIVLHVALAGIFAYMLARRLGLGTWAALCGATIYELSGFFAAHAEHMGVLICAAYIPLAWYAVLRWRDEGGVRPMLILAAAFALSILSGNPPGAAFVIAFSLLFALLLPRLSWRLPTMIGAAAAFAVLLTVVQLAPTFELTNSSVAKYRGDYLKGGVPPQVFVSLLLPNHYNTFDPAHFNGPADLSFLYIYCGLFGLALATLALARASRCRMNLIFAVLALCSAVASLGDMTAPTRALYSLLPQKIVIGLHPELACGPFTLALAILAALAVEQVVPKRLHWAAAAIAAVELIAVNSGRPMNAMPDDTGPAAQQAIRQLRGIVGKTTPSTRIDTAADGLEWAMTAPQTGVYTATGADVMAPERVMQARLTFCRGERWGSWYQVRDFHSTVLGMMNVGYVLARDPLPGAGPAPLRIPGHQVYETGTVLPRFRLVTRVRPAGSMQQAIALLRSADFKPAEEAIVEEDVLPAAPSTVAPGSVKIVDYGLQALRLEVSAASTQFLVTAETHYPGWRAWIDDQPQPIYYTNVAFRGLWVPAGKHTLTMRFQPPAFRYTAAASSLAWLAWIVLWFTTGRRRAALPRLPAD